MTTRPWDLQRNDGIHKAARDFPLNKSETSEARPRIKINSLAAHTSALSATKVCIKVEITAMDLILALHFIN